MYTTAVSGSDGLIRVLILESNSRFTVCIILRVEVAVFLTVNVISYV